MPGGSSKDGQRGGEQVKGRGRERLSGVLFISFA